MCSRMNFAYLQALRLRVLGPASVGDSKDSTHTWLTWGAMLSSRAPAPMEVDRVKACVSAVKVLEVRVGWEMLRGGGGVDEPPK